MEGVNNPSEGETANSQIQKAKDAGDAKFTCCISEDYALLGRTQFEILAFIKFYFKKCRILFHFLQKLAHRTLDCLRVGKNMF